MEVNLKKRFKDYRGNDLKEVVSDKIAEALYSAGAIPEWPINREDKYRAYKICQKIIISDGIVELESEDVTLIKNVCSNFMTAGAYGQIHDLLEKK